MSITTGITKSNNIPPCVTIQTTNQRPHWLVCITVILLRRREVKNVNDNSPDVTHIEKKVVHA